MLAGLTDSELDRDGGFGSFDEIDRVRGLTYDLDKVGVSEWVGGLDGLDSQTWRVRQS